MPDPHRLYILTQLRKQAGISLAEMARCCGLIGARAYESASSWERGLSVPHPHLRSPFLHYLALTLSLHQRPDQLQSVWNVLVEAWDWEQLNATDWHAIEAALPPSPVGAGRASARMRPVEAPAPWSGLAPLPPGSRMPFAPNPHFVGRTHELLAIAEALNPAAAEAAPASRHLAVTGPGGIGKTDLAIAFAHRYGWRFPGGVFWLNCADPEVAPAAIAACGSAAHLNLSPDFSRLSFDIQAQQVQEAWQSDLPRLLIFDGCEEANLLRRWLPQRGGCRALITSRQAGWDASLAMGVIRLGLLSRVESLALLHGYRPSLQMHDSDLIAIAAELDDLPLALHLAGSYLARAADMLTPGAYLTELRQALAGTHAASADHPSLAGVDRSGRSLPTPTDHFNTLDQTFALSLMALNPATRCDRVAWQMLFQSASLAPGEPIPVSFLLEAIASPQATVTDALQRLLDLGLLHEGGTACRSTVWLHPLLCAYLRRHDHVTGFSCVVQGGRNEA